MVFHITESKNRFSVPRVPVNKKEADELTDTQVRAAIGEMDSLLRKVQGETESTRQLRSMRHYDLQQALAAEFGRRNGWTRTRRRFTLYALRNRKVFDGRSNQGQDGEWFDYPHYDHGYFYRTPDKRAAAVVVHLYDIPVDLDSWAAAHGLEALRPDFPSWWNPGGTELVVYVPATEELF